MIKLSDINLLDIGNTIQMAGTIYVGNGKTYLVPFPEDVGSIDLASAVEIEMGIERLDQIPKTDRSPGNRNFSSGRRRQTRQGYNSQEPASDRPGRFLVRLEA